ncbi:hypothetical protein CIK05_05000 [Bdellovibrio sp. qaytius]|nr:hypothetical protein CIK05_05000 [Bdellovibrio sp. qaytius]
MTKIILAFVAALSLTQAVHAAAQIQATPETTIQNQESVSTQDYTSHWFGRVFVNSYNPVRWTITNTGDENLDYASSNLFGSFDFRARHNCTGTLLPGQHCQIEIVYWPAFEGADSGDFLLNFKQDTVQIHVWGEAVKHF